MIPAWLGLTLFVVIVNKAARPQQFFSAEQQAERQCIERHNPDGASFPLSFKTVQRKEQREFNRRAEKHHGYEKCFRLKS